MNHDEMKCLQDERIRVLQSRVDKLEEIVNSVKDMVKDLKDMQNKVMLLLVGTIFTTIANVIVLILSKR